MWNIQLTKADKRRCRELIHIGLERECEQFVREMQQLANRPLPLSELNEPYREENGFSIEGPWHKRYIALYKKTREYDKHDANRYDDITGSRYIGCVFELYLDGIITDEEIAPLSDQPREFLKEHKERFQ